MPPKQQVRDAATVVLLRRDGDLTRILMGQRPLSAAFLPGAWVFPGGAVEDGDAALDLTPRHADLGVLTKESQVSPQALIAAGLRELFEETGLVVGEASAWVPPDDAADIWHQMAETGAKPQGNALRFFARAVTPEGRPRRFDARFFWADAAALVGSPDALNPVEEELGDLAWLTIDQARQSDLAFITRIIVEEIAADLFRQPAGSVPFIHPGGQGGVVRQLAAMAI